MTVAAVWNIADIFNGLMAIPNLIALALLSGVVIRETKDYFRRFPKGKDALPSVGEEPATGDATDFGIPPEGEADAAARAGEIAASARTEARAARERGALAGRRRFCAGRSSPVSAKGLDKRRLFGYNNDR